MTGIPRILEYLRLHYAKDGVKHQMNDVQATNYLEELSRFPEEKIEKAAKQWTRESRFFPALSDLLGILEPRVDVKTQAALAWSEVEKLTRKVSGYDHVLFEDPVLGECVKRTFGTWTRAMTMDQNDPMWASRRNVFLSIYPAILAENPTEPVRVNGIGGIGRQLVCHEATRELPMLTGGEANKSKSVLKEVERRFLKGRDAGAA